jgi:hypothetical protein
MQTITRSALLALAAVALALPGCKTTDYAADGEECCGEKVDGACCAEGEAATLSAANETCPFSGRAVNAEVESVAFNGQEVGFCCNGCATKFSAMSDADKAAALTH